MTGHTEPVSALVISGDGRRVISTSYDHSLIGRDLNSGEALARFYDDEPLYACAIASDGLTIATGGTSGRIHFLRLEGSPA